MNLERRLEAILFASPRPLTVRELMKIVKVPQEEVEDALNNLLDFYEGRGIRVVEMEGGGYHFITDEEFAEDIRKLQGVRKVRLSKAALEVLAIVAVKQPVTRSEIAEMRNNQNSDAIVRQLLEKGLIKMAGKKPGTGGAQTFVTTDLFLKVFNIESLDSIPSIEEITELLQSRGSLSETPKQLSLLEDET